MGKTGSIDWVKVKNRKGKVIRVQRSKAQKAHPGPAQRFTSSGHKRRFIRRICKSPCKVIIRAFTNLFLNINYKHFMIFLDEIFSFYHNIYILLRA